MALVSSAIQAHAQPSGGCSGVSNITIGSTTYVPTWCQEFNGAVGSAIDTTQWNFDLGNNSGWGNGEQEVYCGPPGYSGNPSQCPTTFSTATAPVYIDGNGHLVIQPINENGSWLSGRLNTEGKENFTYGILVASIEGPNTTAQGLWPAWWALGSNITTVGWPTCGESDMFEDWSPQVLNGAGPAGFNSTVHTLDTGGTGVSQRYLFPSGEATNTGFHTYGIVWENNNMQFFVDNPASPFFTVTPSTLPSGDTWPFNQGMFALLNVAVGGTLGGSTSSLTSPASPMVVDYVRWYTPSTGGSTGGVTDAPFGGTPATIAGTVMAENYDTGGQGVAYNVSSINGSDNGYRSDGVDLELSSAPATGNDIGWTAAGQWFNYTVNVATAGTYTVNFLVSDGSGASVSDAFHLSNSSGANLTGSVAVPNTGGWQAWTTVTASVTLPAGVQTLTLNQDAAGWNVNSMNFTLAAATCTSAPSAPTGLTASGTSSSSTTLSWTGPAPSNCAISNYTILENGASVGTSTTPSFTVAGLSPSTTYSFTVEATDTAGTSPESSVLTVTTAAISTGSNAVTPGAQYNLLNPESGANLDVSGCGPGNGTNVQIWKAADGTCNNGAGQVWQANLNSDGTYTFINPESSGALDVSGCGPANGTNIDLWNPANGTCNNGAGQKWSIQSNSNGTYTLINPESSGALDIAYCGTADGTNVDLWDPANGTCNNGAGQQWQFVTAHSEGPSLNGVHVVGVSYNTGYVIDDWAASTAAGNIVDLYTANGTGAQSWNFANTGVVPAGDYNLAVLGPNCLEVAGSGTTNGTKVDIAPCNGQPNQSWNAVPLGTGYTLQPANAVGMCLDSPNWTTTAGTQLQIWQCTGGTNQTWIVN